MKRWVVIGGALLIPVVVYAFKVGKCEYKNPVYTLMCEFYPHQCSSKSVPDECDPRNWRTRIGVLPIPSFSADWGLKSPAEGWDDNYFYFVGRAIFYGKGQYTFYAYADDGIEVYVDGQPLNMSDGYGSCWRSGRNVNLVCFGVTPDLPEDFHLLEVYYFEMDKEANFSIGWNPPGADPPEIPLPRERFIGQGVRVEYYRGEFREANIEGCADDYFPALNFDWGEGEACPGLGADDFSLRFSAVLLIPSDGNYKICVQSADYTEVYIDDELVIDAWDAHSIREDCNYEDCAKSIYLTRGHHPLHIKYYEKSGPAVIKLGWGQNCDGAVSTFTPIPSKYIGIIRKNCPQPPKPLSKRIAEGCSSFYPSGNFSMIAVLCYLILMRLRRNS